MLLELMSTQIPGHWQMIRAAAIKSDQIEPEYQDAYCEKLLLDLLAGDKTCVFWLDDNREICWVFIVRVETEDLRQRKMLVFYNLYGLKKMPVDRRADVLADCIKLCKRYDCAGITGFASHDYIRKGLEQAGFKAHYTTMHYYL